jgi:hypothetical protein
LLLFFFKEETLKQNVDSVFDHVENDIEIRIESIFQEIDRLEKEMNDSVEKIFQLYFSK